MESKSGWSEGLRAACAALAPNVPARPAPATTNADAEEPLAEVVVTGMKASLEKSLDDKRNSAVIQDSIDAEEMGRFPDSDVSDSLEHLPGITITRTTGGDGEKVSVRGFGPQYNIVTLNNRLLATDDDSRDIAFDVLPSEIISAADVLKTSQASALEGSIGGTVNLRTASPFDNLGLHGGVHAEGNYDDMSELYGKKFSAYFQNTMLDNTLGVLVGAVDSNNQTRTDSLNAYTQNIYGPSSYPFTADGSTLPGSTSVNVPLAALPSARSLTTRSVRPCPEASSGARTIPSPSSPTACGPSWRMTSSATTSRARLRVLSPGMWRDLPCLLRSFSRSGLYSISPSCYRSTSTIPTFRHWQSRRAWRTSCKPRTRSIFTF